MEDSRLSTFKFEVHHGRPHGTDNRFIAFEPHIKDDGTTGYTVYTVFHGSRSEIVKAFAEALKDLMPDDKVEVFQTHTLPQYVHEYFGCSRRGTKIEMREIFRPTPGGDEVTLYVIVHTGNLLGMIADLTDHNLI